MKGDASVSLDLSRDLARAEALADLARPLALAAFAQSLTVDRKADHSPVTEADRAIEATLRHALARACPEDGILGEEAASSGLERRRVWVIDPIDGTRAFILGIPLFSTLIALCLDGVPVLGLMDFPALNQRYSAIRGQPSRCNGLRLRTHANTRLAEATYCATSPEMFTRAEQDRVAHLRKGLADMRYGTDAFGVAALLAGRAQGVVESDLRPFDFLASVPLIEGAGGVVSDWQGAALRLDSGPQLLASANPALHEAALARLNA
jgi:histidinol phosphatase-like enzyme (inositol monophosphatase family)